MIKINFASRNYRLIARVRTGLIAASVALCIAMAGMLWAAASLRSAVSALDVKLMEAEAGEAFVRPLLAERGQLVKDLTAMSALMESRKLSWTRFLTTLETVVPRGVALTHVEFSPNDRTVALNGMAQSPEALRTLIVGLEKSTAYKDPFLKHQSLEKGNISFNVVAVYKENTGTAVAKGRR
jgi:Tfp pilus assembly protein PilN